MASLSSRKFLLPYRSLGSPSLHVFMITRPVEDSESVCIALRSDVSQERGGFVNGSTFVWLDCDASEYPARVSLGNRSTSFALLF